MTKERLEGKRRPPLPDLRTVLPAAQAGDQEAQRLLIKHMQRAIQGVLRPHATQLGSGKMEDVNDATMEKLLDKFFIAGLPYNFDPFRPLPDGKDPKDARRIIYSRWRLYIQRTTKSVLQDLGQTHPPEVLFVENRYDPSSTAEEKSKYDHEALLTRAAELLTPDQYFVAKFRFEGKSIDEIVQITELEKSTIKSRLARARRKFEVQILYPDGFRLLTDLTSDQQLQHHVKRHKQFVHVLGRNYTKPAWIASAEPLTEEKGYHLLSAITDRRTAQTIRRWHRNKLRRGINGMFYVHDKELSWVHDLETSKAQTVKRVPSPYPEYKTIEEITTTERQYSRLKEAARRGKLPIKRDRRRIFVHETEAVAFLAEKQTDNTPRQVFP